MNMKKKHAFAFSSIPFALALLALLMIIACGGEPELNSISVNPEQQSVTIGETVSFTAKALSEKSEPMPETAIQWSVKPSDKAAIDSSGVLTAQKPGQVTVIASAGDISGKAQVQIQAKSVAEIKLQAEAEQALPQSTIQVKGKLLAQDNSPAGFHAVSLSTETEGTQLSAQSFDVTEQGDFSFQITLSSEPGPNTVIFKAGNIQETLVVEGTKIVKLLIRPEQKIFEVNEEVQFKVEGHDQFGNHRSVDAEWTVSGDKAELKDGGRLKMLSTGETVIVADYKDLTVGHPFQIVPGKLAEIELHPDKLSLQAGQSEYIKITGRNSHGHILPVKATWHLSQDLGSIDPDGMFVAKKAGTGTLAASQDDVSATIPVEVKPGFLADIELQLEKTSLVAGESIELKASGFDAFGNSIPVEPVWSLDQALGRIDQKKNQLTVYQSGEGAVRVQKENILKAVQINVAPASLHRLEIFPANPTVTAGEAIHFQVKGYDQFNNLISVEPQFELQDPLGDLTGEGMFKALDAGNTVLNVQVGEVQTSTTLAVVPGQMVKAVLTPETPVILQAGEVQDFNIFGLDVHENTVYSKADWHLQPSDIGTVDAQGVLTGIKSGKGYIQATIQDLKSKEAITLKTPVQIQHGEPVRIDIEPEQTSLAAGEKRAFQATVFDKFGNTINTAVTWSLENETIGSISTNGIFEPVKSGEWTITAGLKNVLAHAQVSVVPDEIAYNNITPAQLSLKAGETQKLEAVSEDKFGNVVASDVVWKVLPAELGYVNDQNIFVAQKTGQGHLTAVANNIARKLPLKVEKGPLSQIEIITPIQQIRSGTSLTFQADGFDPGGNPLAFQANWSVVPEDLGRLDESGRFTAVKTGSGQVIATSQGVEASLAIEVIPGKADRIKVLNSTPLEVTAGEKAQLDLQAFDANDNFIENTQFTFEIDGELGTVYQGNRFKAHLAGSGEITVSMDQAQAIIPVKVVVGPVARIEVQPGQTTIDSGSGLTFQATGFDQEGNQVDLEPGWTVIGGIGAITDDGQFTARKVGQGYVSCQMAGIAGLSQIQVKPGPVSRIEIHPGRLEIAAGQHHQFQGTAFDAQDNEVPVVLNWSVQAENDLGEIDQKGYFMSKTAGQGVILAQFEGISGQADVVVTPGTLHALSLTRQDMELTSGEQITIPAQATDKLGNAIQTQVNWKVEPDSLAVVSPSGQVTAQKAGTGKITAWKDNVSASAKLVVNPGTLASIQIQPPEGPIQGGKTYRFKAKGYDAGKNQIDLAPNWAVTQHIGNIDRKTGIFNASKVGKGSIDAYAQGVVASLDIEVLPGELAQLFVDPNPVTVKSGQTQIFQATGMDVAQNAVELPDLTWKVLGDIGFFEKSGVFVATHEGSGKILAAVDSIQAESYVTVKPGEPNPDTSRLRAEPLSVQADGLAVATIIVEVRDASGNPVPGVRVKLVSSRQSDDLEQPGPTGKDGKTIGHITSETAGQTKITALIGQETIRDTVRVRFQ